MDKNFYSLYTLVKSVNCDGCADKDYCSQECGVHDILRGIENLESITVNGNTEGCQICTDKKGKAKEIFYDTGRGGFSIATFCPNCGKKLS